MQLVQKPELYDVLVLPNLYGDIISDWRRGWWAAWASLRGPISALKAPIFEATHGSAPKYKGLNKVNPTALILSGGLDAAAFEGDGTADRLEQAVAAVIAEGRDVTYD